MSNVQDDPLEDGLHHMMNVTGEVLNDVFAGSVFILMVSTNEGDKNRMNYLSNGTREDVIKAMQEFIDRNKA